VALGAALSIRYLDRVQPSTPWQVVLYVEQGVHGDTLRSTDPALRWEVRGRRHAAFTTDFDYSSGP